MVTLPTECGDDYRMVNSMVEKGMDIARITMLRELCCLEEYDSKYQEGGEGKLQKGRKYTWIWKDQKLDRENQTIISGAGKG